MYEFLAFTMADNLEELSKELECSICYELMTPPIYLCRRHHDICHSCKGKISICTICKTPITNLRDYSLEEEAGYLIYACKNDGCNYTCNGIDMRHHEDYCTSRRYVCPISPNCDWYDLLSSLESHVNDCHGIRVTNYDMRKFIVWKRHVVQSISWSYNHYFIVHIFNRDEESLTIDVRLIGPSTEARKHCYVLTFRDCDAVDSMTFVRRCNSLESRTDYEDTLDIPLKMINYLRTDMLSIEIKRVHSDC